MTRGQVKDGRKKLAAQRSAAQRSNDVGVYVAVLMLGGFGLVIWYLLDDVTFPHAVVGYAIAVLGMINFFAFRVWRGGKLAGWQQSLARIPLRPVGFGTRHGKPLEAAKHEDAARNAVLVSTLASLVIVIALALLLIPELTR